MPITKRRLQDLALEILIALAVVSATLLWANSVPPHAPFPTKWVGLVARRRYLFGYALQWCKQYRRLIRFWLAFVTLLLLHSVAFVFVLVRVGRWPLIWFGFTGFVGIPPIVLSVTCSGQGNYQGLVGRVQNR